MLRIILSLFSPHKCCRGRPVMTIRYVQGRHLCKRLGYRTDIFLVRNNPELMTETVARSNKIIFGNNRDISFNQAIQHAVVWISKEHRFNIGIANPHMFHTVFLLIPACQFVFFNHSVKIITHKSTHDKTILRFTIHRLGINIITFLRILH